MFGIIAWLLHFLNRYSTFAFVAYRLVLGAALFGLIVSGALK